MILTLPRISPGLSGGRLWSTLGRLRADFEATCRTLNLLVAYWEPPNSGPKSAPSLSQVGSKSAKSPQSRPKVGPKATTIFPRISLGFSGGASESSLARSRPKVCPKSAPSRPLGPNLAPSRPKVSPPVGYKSGQSQTSRLKVGPKSTTIVPRISLGLSGGASESSLA